MARSGVGGAGDAADEVVLGVDTHLDFHVAVALDRLGRRLGELKVPTTAEGYGRVLRWAEGFGPVRCAGIEGTGSYGAGLARHLKAAGIAVVEIERPKRRHLRRRGKSDPIDAEAAARTVLAGQAAGEPKSGDGQTGMIRAFRSARQSAVKARSQAANQLQSFVVTAPEKLRHRLRGLSTKELVAAAARFRPGDDPQDVETATRFAMRSVARPHEALSEEIAELDGHLHRLVVEAAPGLISLPAIGTHHAATLLVLAGDNPERLKSEASFASLCGVSPVEASSGKVVRHRLNRGGNRDANRALHMICVVRMGSDERTRRYVTRRTTEGKSKWEIMRCLTRYIAREVYRVLLASVAAESAPSGIKKPHLGAESDIGGHPQSPQARLVSELPRGAVQHLTQSLGAPFVEGVSGPPGARGFPIEGVETSVVEVVYGVAHRLGGASEV